MPASKTARAEKAGKMLEGDSRSEQRSMKEMHRSPEPMIILESREDRYSED
ncbi:MAG: hypothetical protein ACK5PZ_08975 [Pirellula sp.]